MNNKIKKSGIMLAAAAAFAFTMAPSVVSANTEKHNAKCFGVNACKASKSSCKAHNSCKGKGFVMVSKKACQQMGGEVKSK